VRGSIEGIRVSECMNESNCERTLDTKAFPSFKTRHKNTTIPYNIHGSVCLTSHFDTKAEVGAWIDRRYQSIKMHE